MSDNRSGYSGGVLRYPVSVVDHKKTLIDPQLQEIQEVIPEEATPENQLADKNYVDNGGASANMFVDLGLPSGTLWADRNVGANAPEEDGFYFSWGNVGWHAAGDGYSFDQTNYDASAGASLSGNIPVSDYWDMAKANFGKKAKLPTITQWTELVNNCTSEWTTQNGVNGILFTSSINGNTIFLPASGFCSADNLVNRGTNGFYECSTYEDSTNARRLYFNSGEVNTSNTNARKLGFSVRAVM